jgi:hypothetical protein
MTPGSCFSDYDRDDMLAPSEIFKPAGEQAGIAEAGACPHQIGAS